MIVEESAFRSAKLGRSRFLAGAGTLLTGWAAGWFFPAEASAVVPPEGCYGYDACPCCSGPTCCTPGCTRVLDNCSPGQQCWNACAYIGCCIYRFQCCDWNSSGKACICRSALAPC